MKITFSEMQNIKRASVQNKKIAHPNTFDLFFKKEAKKKSKTDSLSSPLEVYSQQNLLDLNKNDASFGLLPQRDLQTNKEISPINTSNSSSNVEKAQEATMVIEQAFSSMSIMDDKGSSKTSILLDNALFQDPMWEGTEITIEEFSSAPKIFNVKITASAQAVLLIEAQMNQFLELFKERKFAFGINRIDTEILSPKHLFARKGNFDSQDERNQQGKK